MYLYVNTSIHMQIQCMCVRVAGPYRQRLRLTTCSAEQEVQFYLAYFQALADATEIAQPANAYAMCVAQQQHTHTHTHTNTGTFVRACVRAPHCMQPPAVELCNPWHFACIREVFFTKCLCVYVFTCMFVRVCVCWLHFKV